LQEQDYYRYLVAHNIKKLEQGGRRKSKYKNNEWKIMKEIKNKIQKHNLIITKADKGKTIVIMSLQQYQLNTQKFIQENIRTITTRSDKKVSKNNHEYH
jgi:hypothetical protein